MTAGNHATKPQIRALDRNVLCVAKFTFGHNWKAFIGVVAGQNHEEEWEEVARTGATLDYEVAKVLFPDFADHYPYDR